MKVELHFKVEKETKGAVRFVEVEADGSEAFAAQVGTLYVRKSAFAADRKIPERLVVTVEAR